MSQDPFLKPGDTITIQRLSRSVTISGAVERPGKYQLLPGEGLKELVEIYGSGLAPLADPSRIELVRYIYSNYIEGEKIYLNETDIANSYELSHFDSVTISAIDILKPVMFMEGAVYVIQGADIPSTPESTNRLTVRFDFGENYASP